MRQRVRPDAKLDGGASDDKAKYRLYFAVRLPPLGYATLFVSRRPTRAAALRATTTITENDAETQSSTTDNEFLHKRHETLPAVRDFVVSISCLLIFVFPKSRKRLAAARFKSTLTA